LTQAVERAREQSRARYPDREGYVERDAVRVFYESYGEGERTVVLLPTWSIVHSRFWKAQIPYLSRHARVVTFDGRGNGRSDRPEGVEPYLEDEFAADTIAVMDALGVESATLVGCSCGALWGTIVAADHPDRVDGIVYIGPAVGLAPEHPERQIPGGFDSEQASYEGWAKYNTHHWSREYRDFLEFFFAKAFPEPHSTKQIEDCIDWAHDTTPDVLADTTRAISLCRTERFRATCERVRCPVLVIHGDNDLIRPHAQGAALAEATGGTLVTIEGAGHLPLARDPVKVNLLLRDFISPPRPAAWRRARNRTLRALYISSPIGLGHARRDVAIADELRTLRPGLQIDWLAQSPVTSVLEARGERIHPASSRLANESAHIQSESGEHELAVFDAFRRMDEILVSNFMVFHDVVRDEQYDLWIGDEAWELDYFLHENPELKTAPFAWLTDFVGWLPLPEGGEREAFLTADYNAELIEQIARHPHVRDVSLFVGDPEDVVPGTFGPALPSIADWTAEHFRFTGYVTGFDPAALGDRSALRAELGYRDDEQVCLVTVGGSGVGGDLLRRVADSFAEAKSLVPSLRMILVAGPRIDPASLPRADGLEVRPYVDELYRHLAACDLAIVQGGLTTGMELTAARRPFLVFPLRRHFEQQLHVRHRLERYGAGRYLDFDADGPHELAVAVAEEIGKSVDYAPVDSGGAARAAGAIAELLSSG
jgi:pimeloyl-ACP methyl ester carboxylesterase/predicted glycosyltransferase